MGFWLWFVGLWFTGLPLCGFDNSPLLIVVYRITTLWILEEFGVEKLNCGIILGVFSYVFTMIHQFPTNDSRYSSFQFLIVLSSIVCCIAVLQ